VVDDAGGSFAFPRFAVLVREAEAAATGTGGRSGIEVRWCPAPLQIKASKRMGHPGIFLWCDSRMFRLTGYF